MRKGYQCHMDECQHLHRSDSVHKKQCSRDMIEAGLLKLLQCIFSHKLLRITMASFQVCKGQKPVEERKNGQVVVEWKSSTQDHDDMRNRHPIHENARNRRQVPGNVSNRRQVLEEWRNRSRNQENVKKSLHAECQMTKRKSQHVECLRKRNNRVKETNLHWFRMNPFVNHKITSRAQNSGTKNSANQCRL